MNAPQSSIDLQARDLSLLKGLFESRIMTAAHVTALYFDGKGEAAKKRLQKLKAAGFVTERKRRVNERSILSLTRKSFSILERSGALSDYPSLSLTAFERRSRVSDLTLRHELEVMDVKSAIHSAVGRTGQYFTAEFTTWPLMCQFEVFHPDGHQILVKPDGFLRIHERERDGGISEHSFFLEVDRSSEALETLVLRAGCYLEYYKSGGFASRNGASATVFRDYPFRVLMVFKTAERRNNTAERLLLSNPPIFTQVYLSTFPEVTAKPLDTIWICPQDYRDAVKGTAFEAGRQQSKGAYRRQSIREELVERKMLKHRILVEE